MTTPIRRVLRRAAIRHTLQRFLGSLVLTLTVAGSVLLVLRLLERGGIATALDWSVAAIWAASAAVVVSLVWVLATLPGRTGLARLVDERANLKESLSTALAVESREDAWSRAAVADAMSKAKAISLSSALPFRVPRRWPAPVTISALFLLAGLLPSFTLLGEAKADEETRATAAEIEQAQAEVKEISSQVSETLEKFGEEDLATEFDAEPAFKEPESPEGVRREALAKLTNAKDRLAQLRKEQDGDTMDALREKLRELRQGDTGPLDEFTKALQQGDFEGAKDAMDALKQKLNDGSLTAEQKAQLAQQMKSLSEQLSELAQDRQELERALQKAGLNPDLASADPQALENALKDKKDLSEEQKQALREMAQSTQAACEKCNSMASAASSMGESGEQLSAAEMVAMDAQLSELSESQGSLGDMDDAMKKFEEHMASLSQGMGQCEGSGYDPFARPQPGLRGKGAGDPLQQRAEFATKDEKSATRAQNGPIIGSTFVEGGKIRGEAQQAFSDAVRSSGARAAEAIEDNLVPVEYHDAIKNYFGRLDNATSRPSDEQKND